MIFLYLRKCLIINILSLPGCEKAFFCIYINESYQFLNVRLCPMHNRHPYELNIGTKVAFITVLIQMLLID